MTMLRAICQSAQFRNCACVTCRSEMCRRGRRHFGIRVRRFCVCVRRNQLTNIHVRRSVNGVRGTDVKYSSTDWCWWGAAWQTVLMMLLVKWKTNKKADSS